jgi:cation diffusion facilitator CzcD-associated flavoprotein CzcO
MSLMAATSRRHRERQLHDPALLERVTPTDVPGCKRVLLSDDYYPTLNRPSVEVVTSPITRILPTGLLTGDGVEHPADTIIWGTGFRATEFLTPMAVTAGGRTLREAWQDGAEAYLGISVAGFPNLFLLYGPNTNLGHNSIVYMLESQIRYIGQAVRRLADGEARTLDVRPDVQRTYNEWVQQRVTETVWNRGCTSWYRTASGRNTNNWPDFTFAYRARTRRFDPADYVFDQPARADEPAVVA